MKLEYPEKTNADMEKAGNSPRPHPITSQVKWGWPVVRAYICKFIVFSLQDHRLQEGTAAYEISSTCQEEPDITTIVFLLSVLNCSQALVFVFFFFSFVAAAVC